MTQVQHRTKTAHTDHETLRPSSLTLAVVRLWLMRVSSSISVPSLKLVSLAVLKIWHTMCVSIYGPGDLDLWPFHLETSTRVASKVKNLRSEFGNARLRVLQLFAMYATDGRTDKSKPYCPLPTGGRIINQCILCQVGGHALEE